MSKLSNRGSSKTGKIGRFSFTIGQKLIGVIVLMVVILALVAGTGIMQMKSIGSEIEEMAENEESREKFKESFAKFEELTKRVDKEILEAEELAKGAMEHANTAESKKEFEDVLAALEKIEVEHADYEKNVEHVVELIEGDEMEEALESAELIEAEEEELDHELEALLLRIEKFTDKSLKTLSPHSPSSPWFSRNFRAKRRTASPRARKAYP